MQEQIERNYNQIKSEILKVCNDAVINSFSGGGREFFEL